LFKCPQCGKYTDLSQCAYCGFTFAKMDDIYQLTEDPGLNLDGGKGVKYLGYDRVGPYFSGRRRLECDPAGMAVAGRVAELADWGTILDLGCGDGRLAVPLALQGCTVIAGDISQVMLCLMLEKARHNQVLPTRLIPCRMNALSIPLADNSVAGALAVSILHLISEPLLVIRELYRVIKPGGKLFIMGNSPGLPKEVAEELKALNQEYEQRVNAFHRRYWELITEAGVQATRYSWEFDQHAACAAIFGNHTEIKIDFFRRDKETMADYFLYRLGGKGFSDQQGVPDELHEQVFARVVREFREQYGPDFDQITYATVTDGLTLHYFEKESEQRRPL